MASSLRRGLLGIRKTLNSISMANQTSTLRSETRYRSHLDSITRFSSDTHSFDIDLSNEESKRRTLNKLLYRSKQRGFLELDLVLGKWVEENISTMDESGIKALMNVLDLENPDLWKWVTSQEETPEELKSNVVFCGVREKVMRNLNSHASAETRAIPGKPWVRGWDDLKRGRDSPISVCIENALPEKNEMVAFWQNDRKMKTLADVLVQTNNKGIAACLNVLKPVCIENARPEKNEMVAFWQKDRKMKTLADVLLRTNNKCIAASLK